MQEISQRSGVHPPAIYRRWPSRIAVIEDAAFADLTAVVVEPTGDLRADLRRFLGAVFGRLIIPPIAERRRSIDHTVDLVVRLLWPLQHR